MGVRFDSCPVRDVTYRLVISAQQQRCDKATDVALRRGRRLVCFVRNSVEARALTSQTDFIARQEDGNGSALPAMPSETT